MAQRSEDYFETASEEEVGAEILRLKGIAESQRKIQDEKET